MTPMTAATLAFPSLCDAAFPGAGRAGRAAAVVGMSLLIAAGAQLEVRFPFTPVPLTGQTFGVLLAGLLLGSRAGAAAVALYLLEGTLGLPFFAGGAGGAAMLAGPTGGYLLGFLPAAWLAGRLAERGWDRTPLLAAAAMLLGSAVLFACGLLGPATSSRRAPPRHCCRAAGASSADDRVGLSPVDQPSSNITASCY